MLAAPLLRHKTAIIYTATNGCKHSMWTANALSVSAFIHYRQEQARSKISGQATLSKPFTGALICCSHVQTLPARADKTGNWCIILHKPFFFKPPWTFTTSSWIVKGCFGGARVAGKLINVRGWWLNCQPSSGGLEKRSRENGILLWRHSAIVTATTAGIMS